MTQSSFASFDLASGTDKSVMTVFQPSAALVHILQERLRQVSDGYGPAHDDEHRRGEIAQAAASLTCIALVSIDSAGNASYWAGNAESFWPDDWTALSSKSQRQDLVRAAALLIAEIERLDRLEAPAA